MRIYIATWGNPFAWKKIPYKYKNKIIESSSTIQIVNEVENPDKIIIISLDSISALRTEIEKYTKYNDILRLSESIIKEYIKNILEAEKLLSKTEIVISFSLGQFELRQKSDQQSKLTTVNIIGNSTDFYYHCFYNIAKIFIDYLQTNDYQNEEIEVLIDITHGINFMPVITYSVVRVILNIFGFLLNNVKLKVLNSDPLVGQAPKYLNINIIEETRIVPRIYINSNDLCLSKSLVFSSFLNDNQKREIAKNKYQFNREENELYRKSLIFLSAFYNKLPIQTVLYLPQKEKLIKLINTILYEHYNHIVVEKDIQNNILKIQRNLAFNQHFENLIKVLIVIHILQCLNIQNSDEVSLDQIKNLNNNLFRHFRVEKNRVDVEIENIRQKSKYITKNFQEYIMIENMYRTENRLEKLKTTNTIDKRNFFAHAGFEYNSIKISKKENQILIRNNENLQSQIEDIMIRSI